MNFKKGDIVETMQGTRRIIFKLHSDARFDYPIEYHRPYHAHRHSINEKMWTASGIHIGETYNGVVVKEFYLGRCKKVNTYGIQKFKKEFNFI